MHLYAGLSDVDEKSIRKNLRACLLELRNRAAKHSGNRRTDTSEIVKTEIRKGYLEGKCVDRLVIFLQGTGCSSAKKSGGCTFCGFYNATNFSDKIADDSYLKQFKRAMEQCKSSCPIVCIYNDGSLFCEEEISFNVVKEFMKYLENLSSVKKVVLESRVVDLSEEKIIELRIVFSKKLEIAVGFETANTLIRDFCINKSFSNDAFETDIRFCMQHDVDIIPLMIFKPSFLTEKEAIEDYVNSMKYLERFGLKRVDMEILSIQKDTVAYLLWKKNLFRPPWFWSIIEALKRIEQNQLKTTLYISNHLSYSVDPECLPSNCKQCDKIILELFNDYNEDGRANIFDNMTCSCKERWEQEVQKRPNIESLPLRVSDFLKNLKIDREDRTAGRIQDI